MTETLAEIQAALASGAMTSVDLVERSLARIGALNPGLNAFVALDPEGALAAARQSDARRAGGGALSPLDGAPVSVKDNIHVAGMASTWGSRALAHFTPAVDELPIARLRAAGAVVIGKTNVPEFTLEGYTRNDLFGVTRNPWNPQLTPGGSSGGAAASVAAGMVPVAIGTDGGGSIRRPASHTGLVGWKPSTGRWPRIDGFPTILTDFETLGTLTRNVEDAQKLDACLRGPDARDRRSLASADRARKPERLRVLYAPRFGASPVDPEVAAVTAEVAQSLARAGHHVIERPVFFELEDAAGIWHVVSRAGVAWLMRENAALEPMAGAAARAMANDGRKLTAADYFDALERVVTFRRRLADLFADIDIVLTPTAAALPWPAETPFPDHIDGASAGPRDHAIFTGWVNIAGLPAVSLPAGLSASSLPIGVQIVADFGADDFLLEFAAGMARALSPPPLPLMKASP